MPIQILMPAISPTMTEGTLSSWHKKEGDWVASGDVIAEIETDKAIMEVEAVEEGTLAQILVAAGQENVKVNTPIAILFQREENDRYETINCTDKTKGSIEEKPSGGKIQAKRIFISYRRDESRYQARLIQKAFFRVLPTDNVFMDIHSIPPGMNFRNVLRRWVDDCDIMLVIIVPEWAMAIDPKTKNRRLENNDDFVRKAYPSGSGATKCGDGVRGWL